MERFWYFLIPLIGLMIAEAIRPRRPRALPRSARWPGAILLLGTGLLLTRVLVPAGLVGIALWADSVGIGLFQILEAPFWAMALIGYAVFDLAVWAQHVAMHRVNFLWRFHRVHHADPDFDVTTALRFHPGELLISLAWKALVVVLLGVPAILVLWFEVILNVGAMFNHSNLKLSERVDRWLRLFVVTPDMHRVHHSTEHIEANRNFGFFLPWWDRLFRLYKAQPNNGHLDMRIGQTRWRARAEQSFWALLSQPSDKL